MTIGTRILGTPRGRFGVRMSPTPRGSTRSTGKNVICVHGFPDDASSFDALSIALGDNGHDVASMFLRGYHPSVLEGPYDLPLLTEDLIAVLDALGWTDPVYLVGHDYGAQIGFAAMARHPHRFRAAVTLSGAHPASIAKNARRHPKQLWLSRYIIFFQLGRFADRMVAARSFAYIDRLWRRWSPTSVLDHDHRTRVKATLARSMPAPVAMYRGGGFEIGQRPIPVPTLFIAGNDDGCILPEMSDGQESLFSTSYRRERWEGAGHFPHLEQPGRTAAAVRDWLATY